MFNHVHLYNVNMRLILWSFACLMMLYLECGSDKPLVGRKLDLLVASEENGNKPVMCLSNVCGRDGLCKVYLGSLCEAKNTSVAQMPMVSSSTSYGNSDMNRSSICYKARIYF